MALTEISDFEAQVLQSTTPVFVFFTIASDGHCQKMTPLLIQLSEDYGNRLTFCTLDAENFREKALYYAGNNMPAYIIFKDGNEVAKQKGLFGKQALTNFINPHIT